MRTILGPCPIYVKCISTQGSRLERDMGQVHIRQILRDPAQVLCRLKQGMVSGSPGFPGGSAVL